MHHATDEENDEDDEAVPAKPAKPGKPAKKAPKATTGSKKAKKKPPPAKALPEDCLYKPGDFSAARKAYVKRIMKENSVKYRAASDMWNLSNERAELVASLPIAEQQRRRFI